jgi:hypothetical protein
MLSIRAAKVITKTWMEIEVQPIEHHIATRDVVIKRCSMDDSGEVCCDTETLECHNWLESECVRLAERYISHGINRLCA